MIPTVRRGLSAVMSFLSGALRPRRPAPRSLLEARSRVAEALAATAVAEALLEAATARRDRVSQRGSDWAARSRSDSIRDPVLIAHALEVANRCAREARELDRFIAKYSPELERALDVSSSAVLSYSAILRRAAEQGYEVRGLSAPEIDDQIRIRAAELVAQALDVPDVLSGTDERDRYEDSLRGNGLPQ